MFPVCRAVVAPLSLLLAVGFSSAATAKTGKVSVAMQYISGLKQNGSPDPAKTPVCRKKFGHLLGMRAVTSYDINPQTLMMSATTDFASQTYNLNALGLAGQYAFGQFFRPPLPPLGVYGATFSLSLTFTNPVNRFVLMLDPESNCLLSNSAKSVAGASPSLGLAAP